MLTHRLTRTISGATLSILLGVIFTLGCQSPSQYVSPRIEGRVLNSVSRLPIEGVEVGRLTADDTARARQSAKGGERMEKAPSVYTAADGTFVLDSQRDLAFLRTVGWFSVSLSFSHRAYENFTTTFTPAQATNNIGAEPLIKAGDIYLRPRVK